MRQGIQLVLVRVRLRFPPLLQNLYGQWALDNVCILYKGPSIKDVRSRRELFSADIFRIRGVLQMWTSALFYAKNLEFFEIYSYSVSARTRRKVVDQYEQGRGSIFRDFGQTSFMDSPLCALKFVFNLNFCCPVLKKTRRLLTRWLPRRFHFFGHVSFFLRAGFAVLLHF